MLHLKPKEEKFFEFLAQHSQIVISAAELLRKAFAEPERLKEILVEMDELEKGADDALERIVKKLHKTFITPFDREDIYVLAQKLDDLIDSMRATIDKMYMYNVGPVSVEIQHWAGVVFESVCQLEKALSYLGNLKKQYLKLEARCNRIIELESEGDEIFREEMAKLFKHCDDAIEIIKLKEIFTNLEETLDICEDITEALKKVVLKYA